MGLQSNVNSVLGTAGSAAKAAAPGQIEMPKQKSLEQRQTDANKRVKEKVKALTNQREEAKKAHENFLAYSNKIKQLTGKVAQ